MTKVDKTEAELKISVAARMRAAGVEIDPSQIAINYVKDGSVDYNWTVKSFRNPDPEAQDTLSRLEPELQKQFRLVPILSLDSEEIEQLIENAVPNEPNAIGSFAHWGVETTGGEPNWRFRVADGPSAEAFRTVVRRLQNKVRLKG